ncbi:MAG: UDP-3-O-(3-hydroxymyristoyl)glucosamine N-acyltransferase [Candidatus Marinimicrobia bacterium]|mgnify:FL=1|nr:UDP-3-O-(3-hydroxymyristoyl)glucosamine N-acyltransferase [Candidatus Neomarinimicrobiota bacterium]MBT3839016.1 UDP-3-O-(3-hydroxymyristoyl)glucosamine N-acyltransferase [Candidatus Neomarinimicrobiota bacterium]MBT3999309.1 UDP-3-O-(3-hydroxymyristoyl)glucosamine N-acyltransferase [Candidatus Neomarinimicrobiota bacterium]MBT4282739.1 UDP-3-O-(3-hydroxymyristoyl)glucosamine N-acyltransferase [Candidatus Neomarinimicrobiota bacterium]MBT4578303.1 UDP-3-O-(3-hydroxymyristoyl)glucosamine N-ac
MKLTLREIANHVGGIVIGDSDILISNVSEIQNSTPESITFFANPKYKKFLGVTRAAAIFINDEKLLDDKNGIIVSNPQLAMAKTLSLFFPTSPSKLFIHPNAIIDPTSIIGEKVSIEASAVIQKGSVIGDESRIGANTVIGSNTTIGQNCQIHANVTIYNNIQIGDNAIIHSGTVIGCDGFGFVTENGVHEKIPQTGNVIIGNDVEIGSNCAIDRATIGTTHIDDMTKIDNLVHIAHNVKIGKGCLMAAGFAVAGTSEIGAYCTFAGKVAVGPHVIIGPNSVFAAKSGVTKSIKGGKIYAGYPVREIKDHNKREALLSEVSRIRKKLDHLIREGK